MEIGRLYLAAGGLWHKRGPLWWPDGLHLWWGGRGVHLYWAKTKFDGRHVVWDRSTEWKP